MKQHLLTVMAALCFGCTIAQPSAGLKAYWPLSGNYTDASGNGINGTNFGSTATTNAGGFINTAMNFNNTTSTVTQYATHPVNAATSFSGSQDFSVEFSVYIASPFTHPEGIYDNNLNYGGYGIWLWNSPGYIQVNMNYKNGNVGTPNGTITTNTWYHICCLREAGTLKIYVNGVLKASAAEGSVAPTYTYPARFGTMFFNGSVPPQYNGLVGKIDELRVYNRALSLAEINSLVVLPIKLSNFTAAKINTEVLLQWQTEYEQKSDYFNVQRSTDGINFSNIATVKANGYSSVLTGYQFIDKTIANIQGIKTVYYRLESVDLDARKQNSSIISIKLDAAQQDLMVMQNPAPADLRIQFSSTVKETGTVIITDVTGRQLLTKQLQLNIGTVSTSIPVNMLTAGNYYVTVVTSMGKQTKSFLRQ